MHDTLKDFDNEVAFFALLEFDIIKFSTTQRSVRHHGRGVFTLTVAHYTIQHYRISILYRSYFPQCQTNLSETLHVGGVC